MNIDDIDVDLPSEDEKQEKVSNNVLNNLELQPEFITHLRKSGFGKLTKVQELALPILTLNQDAIIISRTGSGKTLAFLIPLIHKLQQHSNVSGVRAIVMSPTRELAIQTCFVLKKLVKFQQSALRVCLLTGGESLDEQFKALTLNPDVLVATPGRLQFLLQQIPNLKSQLKSVLYLVIDECDQMFEQQLQPQINDIMQHTSQPQIVLCSATLPNQLNEFSSAKLKQPRLIQNETETFPTELFIQNILVSSQYKEAALVHLCQQIKERTLVFVATKYHCEFLQLLLADMGVKCQAIYGSLDQQTRTYVLNGFKNNDFNILLATDVAARGVDIVDLKYVVNFNFPFNPRMYLHRGGRCARNGQFGVYINMVELSELPYLIDANVFVGQKMQLIDLENYLKFQPFPVELEYSDQFQADNKQKLKEHFSQLEVTPDNKEQLEAQYKQLSQTLKGAQWSEYEQFKIVRNYMSNCAMLKLQQFDYSSFCNMATCRSKINNQLGMIPQNILDFKYQNLTKSKVATEYNSARKSMQASLQQLNKQKKSATDAAADHAKELNLLMKASKFYVINYFNQAKFEGVKTVSLQKQLDIIQNFKVTTESLSKRADAGSKECASALKLRQFIEQKEMLRKYSLEYNKETAEKKTNMRYNDPQILQSLDAQISQQKLFREEIVSSKPAKEEKNINIEIQQDEFKDVKGQTQKKVWDKLKNRYVSPQSLVKERSKFVKKVQNSKGEWVEVKEQSLYQKWAKRTQQSVKQAGLHDEVDDNDARAELRLQGLNRTKRRIMKQLGGQTGRTTAGDKHLLQQQLDKNKVVKKQTKSQKIQEYAEKLKKQGVNWQDVKKKGKTNNREARTDFRKGQQVKQKKMGRK